MISLTLALYNIHIQHAYTLATLEVAYSAYSFYLYRRASRYQQTNIQTLSYVYFLIFIVAYSTRTNPIYDGVIFWSFLLPIIFYLLVGTKQGTIATGIAFLLQLTAIFSVEEKYSEFLEPLTINFIACFISVWIASHLYEFHRENTENSLQILASKDTLTNCYNRLALIRSFNQHNSTPTHYTSSLMLLDLDFFKHINDEFGHSIGDALLVEVAKLLQSEVGEDNVFRVGGEEFCVVLFGTQLFRAIDIAEKIRLQIEKLSLLEMGEEVKITASIGACSFHCGTSLNDILKCADAQLYQAKDSGRNTIKSTLGYPKAI